VTILQENDNNGNIEIYRPGQIAHRNFSRDAIDIKSIAIVFYYMGGGNKNKIQTLTAMVQSRRVAAENGLGVEYAVLTTMMI